MRRVIEVLGVIAVLSVLGASATAVLHRPHAGPHAAPTASRQWLRAYGVEVAVPRSRWRLAGPSEAIRYGPSATVRAPAVLDEGFCPSSKSSSRAFVGVLPPQSDRPAHELATQLATWVDAIGGKAVPTPALRRARRVDLDVAVPAGPCAPTTAHLTLVPHSTAQGTVMLILVRDVGEPGDLSSAEAERILQSLRSRT